LVQYHYLFGKYIAKFSAKLERILNTKNTKNIKKGSKQKLFFFFKKYFNYYNLIQMFHLGKITDETIDSYKASHNVNDNSLRLRSSEESLWKLLGQVSPRAKNRPPCSSRREREKNETVVFIKFLERR